MGNKTTGASILAILSAGAIALVGSPAFVSAASAVVVAHPKLSFLSVLLSVAGTLFHNSPVKA